MGTTAGTSIAFFSFSLPASSSSFFCVAFLSLDPKILNIRKNDELHDLEDEEDEVDEEERGEGDEDV